MKYKKFIFVYESLVSDWGEHINGISLGINIRFKNESSFDICMPTVLNVIGAGWLCWLQKILIYSLCASFFDSRFVCINFWLCCMNAASNVCAELMRRFECAFATLFIEIIHRRKATRRLTEYIYWNAWHDRIWSRMNWTRIIRYLALKPKRLVWKSANKSFHNIHYKVRNTSICNLFSEFW